jgi:hypothetical protein
MRRIRSVTAGNYTLRADIVSSCAVKGLFNDKTHPSQLAASTP